MSNYIIAFDLGTGGNKASLYDSEGLCLAKTFMPYSTKFPDEHKHEQNIHTWWKAVVESTKRLLQFSSVNPSEIVALGISGHSLGVVPLDKEGNPLLNDVPIWSDSRAGKQAENFFSDFNEKEWYNLTGNGFPPSLYSIFKILWYRDNYPEIFHRIYKVIGTKDYINYLLTGEILTDSSYASGCGIYNLRKREYDAELIKASGISLDIFPDIVSSSCIIGRIKKDISTELGLKEGTPVVCGGVDNSCMALGARSFKEGRIYNSMGSSSWIAISSGTPIINQKSRPYVFDHVVPGMYTSAVAIFSAGSSFRWARDVLCKNIVLDSLKTGKDPYDIMMEYAKQSPIGANNVFFEPSLAGGTYLDGYTDVRGALIGLSLKHNQNDIIRSIAEGIALKLRMALDSLSGLGKVSEEILAVGGGSKNPIWCQIYSDIYQKDILRSQIDDQAAALGAAALAAVGVGLWKNYEIIDSLHVFKNHFSPIPENVAKYNEVYKKFIHVNKFQARLSSILAI